MKKQKQGIMGACEYSILAMQNLKKDMGKIDNQNQEHVWAIGSMVTILVSNLIKTCNEVFEEAAQNGFPNAKDDIKEIQDRFNDFVDRMIDGE